MVAWHHHTQDTEGGKQETFCHKKQPDNTLGMDFVWQRDFTSFVSCEYGIFLFNRRGHNLIHLIVEDIISNDLDCQKKFS